LALDELRRLAGALETAIARFGATLSPRLLRAIADMLPYQIDLQAEYKAKPGCSR